MQNIRTRDNVVYKTIWTTMPMTLLWSYNLLNQFCLGNTYIFMFSIFVHYWKGIHSLKVSWWKTRIGSLCIQRQDSWRPKAAIVVAKLHLQVFFHTAVCTTSYIWSVLHSFKCFHLMKSSWRADRWETYYTVGIIANRRISPIVLQFFIIPRGSSEASHKTDGILVSLWLCRSNNI